MGTVVVFEFSFMRCQRALKPMKKYDWRTCKNCAATLEAHLQICDLCGASVNGENPRFYFTECARDLIYDWGGHYGNPLEIQETEDLLIWCEYGVFRYSTTLNKIIWRTEHPIVTSLTIENDIFKIHEYSYFLSNGKEV